MHRRGAGRIGGLGSLGGEVAEMCFIVNLPDVGGERKLKEKNYELFSLTEFDGE